MTALEDKYLEKIRARVGALVILTGDSFPRHQRLFLQDNVLNGALDLREMGYVKSDKEGFYSLTDDGWKYARRTLDSIGKTLKISP